MIRTRAVFKSGDMKIFVPVVFDSAKHVQDYYRLKADALMLGRIAERTNTAEAWDNSGKAHAALYALVIGEESLSNLVRVFASHDDINGLISRMNDFILNVVDPDIAHCDYNQKQKAARAYQRQKLALIRKQKRQVKHNV